MQNLLMIRQIMNKKMFFENEIHPFLRLRFVNAKLLFEFVTFAGDLAEVLGWGFTIGCGFWGWLGILDEMVAYKIDTALPRRGCGRLLCCVCVRIQ